MQDLIQTSPTIDTTSNMIHHNNINNLTQIQNSSTPLTTTVLSDEIKKEVSSASVNLHSPVLNQFPKFYAQPSTTTGSYFTPYTTNAADFNNYYYALQQQYHSYTNPANFSVNNFVNSNPEQEAKNQASWRATPPSSHQSSKNSSPSTNQNSNESVTSDYYSTASSSSIFSTIVAESSAAASAAQTNMFPTINSTTFAKSVSPAFENASSNFSTYQQSFYQNAAQAQFQFLQQQQQQQQKSYDSKESSSDIINMDMLQKTATSVSSSCSSSSSFTSSSPISSSSNSIKLPLEINSNNNTATANNHSANNNNRSESFDWMKPAKSQTNGKLFIFFSGFQV
jgi:hypothetical protein